MQIQGLLKGDSCSCNINISTLESFFTDTFSTPNTNTPLQENTDASQYINNSAVIEEFISEEDVTRSLKGISKDTAPGPDKILVSTLLRTKCNKILSLLSNMMLDINYVPKLLKRGRTVLIFKGGNPNECKNWRPITIYSIIRRVIERAIVYKITPYIELVSHQRGFVSTPGTYVNSTLVNNCLKYAKSNKKDCCILFLDVSKAFDKIGHEHIYRALKQTEIPMKIQNIIMSFIRENIIQIESGINKSKPIVVNRGVPQGSPLSPIIFNLSINFILKELTGKNITDVYGFELVHGLEKLTVMAFADDIVIVGNNIESTSKLVTMVDNHLLSIGLSLNKEKCKGINIIKGKLSQDVKIPFKTEYFSSISHDETIKYLGINYCDEIKFNKAHVINKLKNNLEKLVSTVLLKADQKINIINQYIWPSLIYPLQCAPLNQLPQSYLEDIDIIIRSAVKEIIGLPNDCPSSMLYAPHTLRGLNICKASWEAYLQHYNICSRLMRVNDIHLHEMNDFKKEQELCLKKLKLYSKFENIFNSPTSVLTSQKLRQFLREESFNSWSNLTQKGKGIMLFKETPKYNKIINTKNGLSISEWTSIIKMNANIAAVRAVPGRSQDNHCRHSGCSEIETLSHVLGSCAKGELLRNLRHHKIRSLLANSFKTINWETYEEVPLISSDGSNRRGDIIAINRKNNIGLIIDPTIRFEQDDTQPQKIDKEKKDIYNPCIPYLKDKYSIENWEVIGILIGSRGTISKFFVSFLKKT